MGTQGTHPSIFGTLLEDRGLNLTSIGVEHCSRFADPFLHPPDASSPDRHKPRDAHDAYSVTETPP